MVILSAQSRTQFLLGNRKTPTRTLLRRLVVGRWIRSPVLFAHFLKNSFPPQTGHFQSSGSSSNRYRRFLPLRSPFFYRVYISTVISLTLPHMMPFFILKRQLNFKNAVTKFQTPLANKVKGQIAQMRSSESVTKQETQFQRLNIFFNELLSSTAFFRL